MSPLSLGNPVAVKVKWGKVWKGRLTKVTRTYLILTLEHDTVPTFKVNREEVVSIKPMTEARWKKHVASRTLL